MTHVRLSSPPWEIRPIQKCDVTAILGTVAEMENVEECNPLVHCAGQMYLVCRWKANRLCLPCQREGSETVAEGKYGQMIG